MTLNTFIETYTHALNTLENEKNSLLQALKAEHREDEATMIRIETNVIDIFRKMFDVAVKKTQTSQIDWENQLSNNFLPYFEKITTPWQERLKKCNEFDLPDEAHVEMTKLEIALILKSIFESHLFERSTRSGSNH